MKKLNLLILLFVLTAGCTTEPYKYPYDPNEKIVYGSVTEKQQVKNPNKFIEAEKDASMRQMELVQQQAQQTGAGPIETSVAVIILNMLGFDPPGGTNTRGDPYAYKVRSELGDQYIVMSYWPLFEVGQCVKLFISDNPDRYPSRMTDSTGCKLEGSNNKQL